MKIKNIEIWNTNGVTLEISSNDIFSIILKNVNVYFNVVIAVTNISSYLEKKNQKRKLSICPFI